MASSPSLRMHLQPAANKAVTGMLNFHGQRGCTGVLARTFIGLTLFGSTATCAVGLWYSYHDVHIRFWLGDLPIVSMAVTLSTLAITSFMLIYKSMVNSQRGRQNAQRASSKSSGGGGGSLIEAESKIRFSLRTLRLILIMITILSVVSATLGFLVVKSGLEMSSSLTSNCGMEGNSLSITKVEHSLQAFYKVCQQDTANKGKEVDECPGFAEEFPAPAPYPSYLKIMEYENKCSGFCAHGTTIFNLEQPKVEGVCGKILGVYLWSISYAVGVPSIFAGMALAIMSLLLLSYEGL